MKRMKDYGLWLGLLLILNLMIIQGCDSWILPGDVEPPAPSPTPAPPQETVTYEGNYVISNVEDLEAIVGYTEITGDLRIVKTSITNLDGLESLRRVGGGVLISGGVLENVDGLCNLSEINGYLGLEIRQTNLTNIDGFSSLTTIGGSISIIHNNALSNLDGLMNSQVRTSAQVSIYCNQNLPLWNVNQLLNGFRREGWNGCYVTALTCPPVEISPHGWCSCSLLPMERQPPNCWRFEHDIYIP